MRLHRPEALSGGPALRPSRHLTALISVVCGALLLLGTLGTVNALDQSALPGGAPGPRPGSFQPRGFVRVVAGDTFEVQIDDKRVNAGVLGIKAAQMGTP